MIVLPPGVHPNGAVPALLDFGGVIRPSTGAKLLRLDRGGNRFRAAMTLPVQEAEDARRIVARLIAAKSEGLRVAYPLQGVDQGSPYRADGSTFVVDGAGQAGSSIALRGGVPGYAAKEGFWLTIHDGSREAQGYLHNVKVASIADEDGALTLTVGPNLRIPFPDGAHVELAEPTIEGLVDSDISWELALFGLVDNINFTIEEAE
jgi:hypothetical protein